MRIVFLDTVGLIATWDEKDQWHEAATRVFLQLLKDNAILITTEFVLAECGNSAARKPYRSRVPVLREQLKSQGRLVLFHSTDLETAWRDYQAGGSQAAGIVDTLSFLAMRRNSTTEAFTNDQHVKAAGFTVLF